MKIRTITYSMTRQIEPFKPGSYSISADITEDEDFEKCCKELQRMTIRVLYKDQPTMRDSLITQLVDVTEAIVAKKPDLSFDSSGVIKSHGKPLSENNNFFNEKEAVDNEPPPNFID